MRGRPPLPESTHRLRGTLRPGRHAGSHEPRFAGEPSPGDLAGDALKAWNLIVPPLIEAHVCKAADEAMLRSACRWFVQFSDAMRKAESPETDDAARYKLLILASIAWKQFANIAIKYGLTPADRQRLKEIGGEQPTGDDPFDALRGAN